MMGRRRKVMVTHAPEGAWYAPIVGKPLWVDRKSVHTNSEGEKVYNLHFAHTDKEIRVQDTFWIPKYVRKFFHAINLELNSYLPPQDMEEEDGYREVDPSEFDDDEDEDEDD